MFNKINKFKPYVCNHFTDLKSTHKETRLKFCKVTAISKILYCSEDWTLTKSQTTPYWCCWNEISQVNRRIYLLWSQKTSYTQQELQITRRLEMIKRYNESWLEYPHRTDACCIQKPKVWRNVRHLKEALDWSVLVFNYLKPKQM